MFFVAHDATQYFAPQAHMNPALRQVKAHFVKTSCIRYTGQQKQLPLLLANRTSTERGFHHSSPAVWNWLRIELTRSPLTGLKFTCFTWLMITENTRGAKTSVKAKHGLMSQIPALKGSGGQSVQSDWSYTRR